MIEAKGQVPEDGYTSVIGRDRAVKLDGVTGEIDGSIDRLGIGTGDSKTEFADVALRQERESEKKQGDMATCVHR